MTPSSVPVPACRPAGGRRSRTRVVAVALLGLTGVLAGCGSDGSEGAAPSVPQTGAPTTSGPGSGSTEGSEGLAVTSVAAASMHEPIALIARPGDEGHLWVAERAGRVRRVAIEDGGESLTAQGGTLLDLTADTSVDAERGLLGIAFSPEGDRLYASFTDRDGNSRIVRYPVDGDEVDQRAGEPVYRIDQPYPNHNGGHLTFGPDGALWFGLGDGGAGDDPENRAQDPSTDLGKIIRIDVETGESEIVVSGVRNPWRWAFDTDGSLWIADVGQNAIEEVDHLPADRIEGANLGWSGYEGSQPYLDGDGRRPADAIGPVFEYPHENGNCSITGGFPYHGEAIPALVGGFLFADYCAGRVRAIFLDDEGRLDREVDLGVEVEQPISFGQDQQGEPYVLSATGDVVRILPG